MVKRKYGKKVLYYHSSVWNGNEYEIFICQSKEEDTIDIHILDSMFQLDELNTLHMQDSIKSLEEYCNEVKCDCMIIEHILWTKYQKYSFNIEFRIF